MNGPRQHNETGPGLPADFRVVDPREYDGTQPRHHDLGGGEEAFGAPRGSVHDTLDHDEAPEETAEDFEDPFDTTREQEIGHIALDPTKEKKSNKKRNAIIAAVTGTAVAAAGAIGFGVLGDKRTDDNQTAPPQDGTVATAPEKPGETTTSTPEKEVTADTVELRVNGQTYIGIDDFYAKNGLFKENNPDLPLPTQAESEALWSSWVNVLQTGINVETGPDAKSESFADQAVQKLLFVEGEDNALSQLVAETRDRGAKVIGIEKIGFNFPTFKPDERNPASGSAILLIQEKDGSVNKYHLTGALIDDYGVLHSDPEVGTAGIEQQ